MSNCISSSSLCSRCHRHPCICSCYGNGGSGCGSSNPCCSNGNSNTNGNCTPDCDGNTQPPLCSMVFAINPTTQTPAAAGDPLVFSSNPVMRGTAISHTEGNSVFSINEPGVYSIAYSVVATDPAGTATISVQLENNGVVIPGSLTSGTITAANDSVNLANTILLNVTDSASITLNTVNEGSSFSNASIVIKKEAGRAGSTTAM